MSDFSDGSEDEEDENLNYARRLERLEKEAFLKVFAYKYHSWFSQYNLLHVYNRLCIKMKTRNCSQKLTKTFYTHCLLEGRKKVCFSC